MTFAISSILVLVAGVYYPFSVLPAWMKPLATVSPATFALEGMRAALLDGAPTGSLGGVRPPILLLVAAALPAGQAIFGWAERDATRTGKLKRSR